MTYGTFLFLIFQNCTHFAPIFERCAFLTNAKHLSALDVANLYKKRWLVELFFYDKFIVMQSSHTHADAKLLIA